MKAKISIKHHGPFFKAISLTFLFSMLLAALVASSFILIIIFLGIFSLILSLWALLDKTIIKIDEKNLVVKEIEKALSKKNKIKIQDLVAVKWQGEEYIVNPDQPAPEVIKSEKGNKLFKKNVLYIQTGDTVYKVGKKLEDESLTEVYTFIKDTISAQAAK